MIEFFKKIKQKFSFFISKDIVILPEQGDVLEDKDGKRYLVTFVDEDFIYVGASMEILPNRRGRSKNVVVSNKIEWPSNKYLLYRGSNLLYPQKNYKLLFLVWLSKKILK